ncbi:MAG: LuxR C-terminal-related transcriptional regulator [Gammaproteobacteria bacterium]|nr:LuxR C-terminal-related transcriptional regulator [Gammaproteobacteria bacterium]
MTGSSTAADGLRALDDARRLNAVLIGLLELLNDDISGSDWLAMVARHAGCDSATCFWWPAGRPEFFRRECSGPAPDLTPAHLEKLDALIRSRQPQAPGFIDDWASGPMQDALLESRLLLDSRKIICVDWDPAAVVVILDQRADGAKWPPDDHERLTRLMHIVHKSVAVKKRLSWNDDIADLVNKVFDEIPRGFIAMMPDRQVVLADKVARNLMDDGTLLRLIDGKLTLRDGASQNELVAALETIERLPVAALETFRWRKNLTGRSGPDSYLAVTRGFEFDQWRRESTPYSRVAVMVVQNQTLVEPVDAAHVEEFFNLTPAQARVVVALAQGESAETAAASLNISVNTVRSHLRSIYAKLEVSNKAQMLHRVMASLSGGGSKRKP